MPVVAKFDIDDSTVIICLCMFRIYLDGPVVIRNCLPVVAKLHIGNSTVIICLCVVRIDLDGPVII